MGMFDWIPTLPEILDYLGCRAAGHTWVYSPDKMVRQCELCGKIETFKKPHLGSVD